MVWLWGGRFGSVESYRYGYQGSEKDDEIKGQGNYYTTFFRGLDPRLGKWLSVDPKASSLPWQSPLCSMDNNPVLLNDVLGDSIKNNINYDNTTTALKLFLSTKSGYKYIAKYASKGQVIEGYKFNKDGKYHKKGGDLVLTDIDAGSYNGGETVTKRGGGYVSDYGDVGVQNNGRFRINVNINSNLSGNQAYPDLCNVEAIYGKKVINIKKK